MTAQRIFNAFLDRERAQGTSLAAASDRVDLVPVAPDPPMVYVVRFTCCGLIRVGREVVEHADFLVGIRFPESYLHHFDTAQVLTWLEPATIWHPNIRPPFVCAGRMEPGTPLVDLLYQLYEIITWQNVEMREHDALNPDACAWARRNRHRFPVDRRPLKRPTRLTASHGREG